MAALATGNRQLRWGGAVLAIACLLAGPALASIVPSTVPPEPPVSPPAAPPAPAVAPPAAAMPAAPDISTPASIKAAPADLPPAGVPPTAPPPGWTAVPDAPAPATANLPQAAPALGTVTLEQPQVPDTGRLSTPTRSVELYGVTGLAGEFATSLHGAIAADGGTVTCEPQDGGAYRCALPDGTDIAALALRNGAAQTRTDAPAQYHELEALARDERRGVWSSLPPPPVRVEHPTVVDTATLTAAGTTYRLDGVSGLGGHYARDLQGYIQANGDWLSCSSQGETGEYVCLLQGQTDLAKLALVNGAARVAADAPDSYRVEQGDALTNRRGYWKNPPAEALVAARAAPVVTAPPLPAGDDGGDGVRYVGGAPAAVIDGQTVFLMFAGAAGWGYWDHQRRWHGAPARYGRHMERYHPSGQGLRGYRPAPHPGSRGAFAGNAGFHPARPPGGFVRPPQIHRPGPFPGIRHAPMPHPGGRPHR